MLNRGSAVYTLVKLKKLCEQIVLQDSADDNSFAGVGVQDQSEGREPQREDFREDDVAGDEIPRVEHEYFDGFPQDYNGRKGDLVGRRMPFMNSSPADIPVGDEILPFSREEPANYPSSRGQIPRPNGVNFGSSHEGRYALDMPVELYNANLYACFFSSC